MKIKITRILSQAVMSTRGIFAYFGSGIVFHRNLLRLSQTKTPIENRIC